MFKFATLVMIALTAIGMTALADDAANSELPNDTKVAFKLDVDRYVVTYSHPDANAAMASVNVNLRTARFLLSQGIEDYAVETCEIIAASGEVHPCSTDGIFGEMVVCASESCAMEAAGSSNSRTSEGQFIDQPVTGRMQIVAGRTAIASGLPILKASEVAVKVRQASAAL